ncbi:hypothetical protein CONLIGDRAFT_638397 [Coniochaeta ligniaria NRRL 30616]|uniref:Uncharacterized protein n=1 Tax=Coniochaeta ligniaria NRRL 30616 TaxID=1408157 RepID=A0A1J7IZP4_9PEZI|nr:hypothetical protein CONLIGDRAFT_638397 [Coniochaeta ligniaria NRRL 30616]
MAKSNGIGTRYRPSGKLAFDGVEPANSVIRSICSDVCQDDDALLPRDVYVRCSMQPW